MAYSRDARVVRCLRQDDNMRRPPVDEPGAPVEWDIVVVLVLLVTAVLTLVTFELWAPHEIPWY